MTTPAQDRAARWRGLWPSLTAAQVTILEDLVGEILRWNKKIALTSPGDFDTVALRLIDDSLLLVPHVRGDSIIDVGSGPGIPGLALSAALPGVEVRTVESIGKKVAFTRAFAARQTALKVRAFQGRAEGKSNEPWGTASTVVSRALAAPAIWIPLGAPLVAPGGRLIVTLGADEGQGAAEIASKYGLSDAGGWTGTLAGARRAMLFFERPS